MMYIKHTINTNIAADLRRTKNVKDAMWTRYYCARFLLGAFYNNKYVDIRISEDRHVIYLDTNTQRNVFAWKY
jgi:hypothetical protein